MTQQYMPGYPPVQTAPGPDFQHSSQSRPGPYDSPQNSYNYPQTLPLQNETAYNGPPSGSYSQPSFDPYAQQQVAGQLTPYNPPATGQLTPYNPLAAGAAADGALLPPQVAPDGTLLPLAPISPNDTAVQPFRPRTYSTSSKHSHHSSHSHRSSRSSRERREAEIERRPTWADSLFSIWGALKGSFDKREV